MAAFFRVFFWCTRTTCTPNNATGLYVLSSQTVVTAKRKQTKELLFKGKEWAKKFKYKYSSENKQVATVK